MKIKIYKTFNKYLKALWSEFEIESNMSPFQSYTWLSNWYDVVGEKAKIHPLIIIIRKKEELIAIFPMSIKKTKFLNTIEWLGGMHCDYMAPLLKKGFIFKRKEFLNIWEDIQYKLPSHDLILLSNQPSTIGSVDNPFVKFLKVKEKTVAYSRSLKGNWEKFYNKILKKKIRLDSKRNLRNLEKIGKVEFIISDSKNNSKKIIEKMIVQKRYRYISTGSKDLLLKKEHRDFYFRLSDINSKFLNLHFSAIKINNKIIASHFGFIFYNCFYYLMPANESGKWRRFSPGRLLLEKLLELSYNSGLNTFDFTIGGESYKKIWCNNRMIIYEYQKPSTSKGYFQIKFHNFKTNYIYKKRYFNIVRQLRIYLFKFNKNRKSHD